MSHARLTALQHESERICSWHATSTLLWTNVRFDSWNRHEPGFRFDLNPDTDDVMGPYNPPLEGGIDARLGVLSTMLAHSGRLSSFPALKRHFWATILESREIQGHHEEDCFVTRNWHYLIDDDDFPVFQLELDGQNVTAERLDALYRFFTTPAQHEMEPRFANETVDLDAVRVALSFEYSTPAPPMLRRLEAMLDRVFAHPYGIASLKFEGQSLSPTQLPVIRSMLQKNEDVYKIDSFQLPRSALGLDAATAACTVSALYPPESLSRFSSLNDVSVDLSQLNLSKVAALCSILRYGSRLESFVVGGDVAYLSEWDQVQSWRWLAFAVFYPRSKKLSKGNRLHALNLPLDLTKPDLVAAIIDVFASPVTALVYPGTARRNAAMQTQRSILLCTIKQGAQFYAAASGEPRAIHRLASECELEALVQEPGWMCVVLPGDGLAWVKNDHVVRTEREPADDSHVHGPDQRYVQIVWLPSLADDAAARERFFSILSHIGGSVSLLNLGSCFGYRSTHTNLTIRTVLRHCVNLQHLIMSNSSLCDDSMDALVDMLESEIGDHLVSLNLDLNHFTLAGFDRLARWLSNPTKIPPLRELRLVTRDTNADSLATFSEVLEVNKTLKTVHFMGYPLHGQRLSLVDAMGNTLEDPEEEQIYIDEQFQGEVLPGKLALARKLAFLSVLRRDPAAEATTASETSRHELDSFMVASIFRFAAHQTRRRILWETFP